MDYVEDAPEARGNVQPQRSDNAVHTWVLNLKENTSHR